MINVKSLGCRPSMEVMLQVIAYDIVVFILCLKLLFFLLFFGAARVRYSFELNFDYFIVHPD